MARTTIVSFINTAVVSTNSGTPRSVRAWEMGNENRSMSLSHNALVGTVPAGFSALTGLLYVLAPLVLPVGSAVN